MTFGELYAWAGGRCGLTQRLVRCCVWISSPSWQGSLSRPWLRISETLMQRQAEGSHYQECCARTKRVAAERGSRGQVVDLRRTAHTAVESANPDTPLSR